MGKLSLESVRVLDLSMVWAGPFLTKTLGDLGAEIIKIESRNHPDIYRGPLKPVPGSGVYPDGKPGERPYNRYGLFNEYNRNKYGIGLDLSTEAGAGVFKRLVRIADLVVENFRPGVMERLGLGYEVLSSLNPSIIMISLPGFGSGGPESHYMAFGLIQEAMSGLSSITGYSENEPLRTGVEVCDAVAAMTGAAAAIAALRQRRRTGKGQHIEISQREAQCCLLGEVILDYIMNGRLQKPMGNRHPLGAFQGVFRCQGEDRWVAITLYSDDEWGRFVNKVLGNPPWSRVERFGDLLGRLDHYDELARLIEDWTSTRDHLEVMNLLQKEGIDAVAVMTNQEIMEDPHLRERGYFEVVAHPEAGTHTYPGFFAKLSRTPAGTRMPAPCFGQHNEYVYGELLGMSLEEMAELGIGGVSGKEIAEGSDIWSS